MKTHLARLHLYALAHSNIVLAVVMAMFVLGRLTFTNPPIAVAIALLVAASVLQACLPQQMRLSNARFAFATIMTLFGTSILFAGPAEAITIGGIATAMKNDMGSVYDAIVYGCYGVGITSTAVGVNNGIKKSKGDQQVTTGSIFGYGLGGPALGMVGYIMDSAGESMGGGASSMNKLPGGLN